MDRILALIAFAVLAAFILLLIVQVGTLDLWVLGGLTLLLAGYDALSSTRDRG